MVWMPHDADSRLRKLEPVIGKQEAKQLWVALRIGSPRTRKAAEARINYLCHTLLDLTYREEQILLPVPADLQGLNGPIKTGAQLWYDGPRGELGLREDQLVTHCGVVGSSGSGKSTLMFSLLRNLIKQNVPTIIIDPKRSYRSLLPLLPQDSARIYTLARPSISPLRINLQLEPPEVDATLFDSLMTSVMDEVLYGGFGSHSIMKGIISKLRQTQGVYSMLDVSNEIGALMTKSMGRRRQDWLATAHRLASEISSVPFGLVNNWRDPKHLMFSEIDKATVVIMETDLMSFEQQKYFIVAYLLRTFLSRLGTDSPDKIKLFFLIEEATRLFGGLPSPNLDNVIQQAREKGIALGWVVQSASEVSHSAYSNTNNLFCFKQVSPKDLNTVASAIAFEKPEEKKYLARLQVGECIARLADAYPYPLYLRTSDYKKPFVSDQQIHELAKAHLAAAGIPFQVSESPTPIPHLELTGANRESKAKMELEQRGRSDGSLASGRSGVQGDLARLGEQDDKRLGSARGIQSQPGQQENTGLPGLSGTPGQPDNKPVFSDKPETYALSENMKIQMAHLLDQVKRHPQKQTTFQYLGIGIPKATGSRLKSTLMNAGLLTAHKATLHGRHITQLRVTPAGHNWLEQNKAMLSKTIKRYETRRFGGAKSRHLEQIVEAWAAKIGATVQKEVSDGFGGMHDILLTLPSGEEQIYELVSGESKTLEPLHALRNINSHKGRRFVGVCLNETIKGRMLRYFSEAGLEVDGDRIRLITPEELGVT